jgi:hypothetical protein
MKVNLATYRVKFSDSAILNIKKHEVFVSKNKQAVNNIHILKRTKNFYKFYFFFKMCIPANDINK